MADNREFKTNLLVTQSPHYVTNLDTQRTMLYVCIGLLFPTIAATYFFGLGALLRVVLGAVFAVAAEWCYEKVMKKPVTIQDFSACVTGMILALNVPSNFPIWMLAIGCGVAIVIVKCLYGGLGRNFANPALVGRAVLLISWTTQMTTWPRPIHNGITAVIPGDATSAADAIADAITGATPLGELADGAYGAGGYSLLDLFLGNIGGAMGETCKLAILIGGGFLIWKKIISPMIPCAFIATVFILSLFVYTISPVEGYNAFYMALSSILTGGVFFGAFFCATDYVTSPIMERGRLIYGIGCGALTVMIRTLGSYPEGVSFAILLMNICTPLIDMFVERQFYGIAAAEKAAKKAAKEAAKAEAAGSDRKEAEK